jgi:dephospho-CoA kinase
VKVIPADRQPRREFRVGLTGGIASGKSTVAHIFEELAVPVIDTDAIAREVVAPGQPALAEIVAAFGPAFLDQAGALDRWRLRAHVFEFAERRRQLEAILHPRIEAMTLAACSTAGGPYQLLVVPLLIESGFRRRVDRILVVDCSEDLQRARLLARDSETPEQIERILAAQTSRERRLEHADDIIVNDGPLARLRSEVERLHGLYLRLAVQFSADS